MINIKDFDPNLIKINKKSYKNTGIYNIGYITKKDEYKINSVNSLYLLEDEYKINSVNSLYLLVGEVDGCIEENNRNKYFNIALIDNNCEVLMKYTEILNKIQDQIKKINNGRLGEYEEDYMRIKFNSGNDLPLNKILKFRILSIIIRAIFEEDDKYYPQVYLD